MLIEAIKNICCMKEEVSVDHITVTRWFKKFCSGCKNLDDQTRLGRLKTMNFKAVFQAIEGKLKNIQKPMLYKFKLGHNAAEVTKNICCMIGESAVNHCTITRWLKKFYSGCKNLNNQARSGRPKSVIPRLSSKPLRLIQYLTVQYDSSPSHFQQKHWKLLNCASC